MKSCREKTVAAKRAAAVASSLRCSAQFSDHKRLITSYVAWMDRIVSYQPSMIPILDFASYSGMLAFIAACNFVSQQPGSTFRTLDRIVVSIMRDYNSITSALSVSVVYKLSMKLINRL